MSACDHKLLTDNYNGGPLALDPPDIYGIPWPPRCEKCGRFVRYMPTQQEMDAMPYTEDNE